MNKVQNYDVPEGYRKAQAILLHDDHIYLVIDWTPDLDERPFFQEGYYHYHPFMWDDDYRDSLDFIAINTLYLRRLAQIFGSVLTDEVNIMSDLPILQTKHIDRYGGESEAYDPRSILALYVRMEAAGAISIIIVERLAEDGAPVVKRELTYRGKYSIYWGAEEVTE